jgi:thymidine kinase
MSKFYYYFGNMRSQKSMQLIATVHSFKEKGKKCLLFKPATDTREQRYVKSRALKTTYECTDLTQDTFEIVKMAQPHYVFIDECQFASKEDIDMLARIVDELQIPVFAYGLLVDYRGQLFEGSKRLVELADSIREIKSICDRCDSKAKMHLLKVDGQPKFDGDGIFVGDLEFESLCRKCYINIRKEGNNQ